MQGEPSRERISVNFDVLYEVHDLIQFQNEGHFVCGLKDEHGFPRQWETDEVHVLTLQFTGESPLYKDKQILRVMADTQDEVEVLMRRTITKTLFSLWAASQLANSKYGDWVAQNELRNQFQCFINSHYAREIETGKHAHLQTVFDVAVHYMRKERNRLVNRIGRWLRRQKPAPQSEWIPQEWRQ